MGEINHTHFNTHAVRVAAGLLLCPNCGRGYHVYKEVWDALVGEELPCRRDLGNPQDPFAVAMVRAPSGTVGHVVRKISSVCSIFLRCGDQPSRDETKSSGEPQKLNYFMSPRSKLMR